MKVSLIVAVAENMVIGKDNDLIWHLPKDMKFFKTTTESHYVIMGRRNYESIPDKYRPLPNRPNIIVTRQQNFVAEKCDVVNSIEAALEIAKTNNEAEAFVIGGGQIYRLALEKDLIDTMYITHIHQSFDGDTYFPEVDLNIWKETNRTESKADEKNAYDFSIVTYEKK
jgi:dihydrofolate reductase